MKKYLGAVLSLVILSGCGQGPAGPQGVPGVAASAAPVDSNSADVADVLQNGAHGNAYRLGLGQTELSSGLTCSVVHVSGGQCLSNSASGSPGCVGQPLVTTTGTTYSYLYAGGFDQPNDSGGVTNLLPAALQSLFVGNNYKIVCNGYLVIQQPGWYEFEDISDDGSIIVTDGGSLYNDGNHAVNTVPITQSVYFDRDVHTFQVQYAQTGGGNFGLILNMNNQSIPNLNLYH